MDWGMANRLARLIQPDGHCMFLPIDHGYFQGPTRMLEQPGETIKPLLPYSDALFVTRGVLRAVVDSALDKPVILRMSGGTSMVGADLADEGITTSMEDAVRLNVAAVGISVFIGTEFEKQSLLNLGKLVDEGEKYGIPVMAVTAVGKELEKRDARYLALCSRICAELAPRWSRPTGARSSTRLLTGARCRWSWPAAPRPTPSVRSWSSSKTAWTTVPSALTWAGTSGRAITRCP